MIAALRQAVYSVFVVCRSNGRVAFSELALSINKYTRRKNTPKGDCKVLEFCAVKG